RTLFRAAHSVKGAARVAVFPFVGVSCHELDEIYARVRVGARSLSHGEISLLFSATDAAKAVALRLRANEPLDESMLPALVQRLQEVSDEHGDTPSPARSSREARTSAAATAAGEKTPATDATSLRHEAPVAAKGTTPATGDALPAQPPGRRAAERAEATAVDTVRVSAEKLDQLAAYTNDLLTMSGALAARPRELDMLQQDLARWAGEWRQVAREHVDVHQREEHADL